MLNKSTILILLMILGFNLGSFAQTHAFSLREAQDYAVKNNFQAQNAIIDVAIAAHQVKENLATGLPQISSNIGYNNFINLATSLIPAEFFGGEPGTYMEVSFGTRHNATIDAQLNQLIFSGSYFVGLKAAKTFEELSKLQLEQVEQDVKEAIANAYYLVLISEENKKLMEETVSTMEKLFSDTRALYKQGFMQDTDVDKLELLVMDLKTNLLNAKNQIKNAGYLLKFNLGLKVTDELKLTDELNTLIMAVNPKASLQEDFQLDQHLTYRLMNTQETISELQVRLAKTMFMPTVSGFLSQSQSAQRNAFNFFASDEKWFPTTVGGVQISIPIFSSGNKLHKLKQRQLDLVKTRNTQLQVNESLMMGALSAKNNFEVAVETYDNKIKNFDLARKIYDKEQIRYKNGMASSTDINQSYNTLLESQGTYLGSIMDLMTKKLALDKAYNNL